MTDFLWIKRLCPFLPYIAIVTLSILIFIVPCREWNIIAEDYPIIYHVAKVENLKDFGKFIFVQANVLNLCGTQNPINPKIKDSERLPFFDSFYRPGLMLVQFIEYHLFGLKAFLYRLFMILLHIINSLILFYIFKLFFKKWIAFLCTIFFLFNSTLIVWLGRIETQQHQIDLLFFLFLCLCLIRLFLTNNNSKTLLILVGFFHLLCLSIREEYFVTPLLILLLIPLICKNNKFNLYKIILITFILGVVTLIYIFMKQLYYPFPNLNFSMHNPGEFSISILQFMTMIKTTVLTVFKEFYVGVVTVFINYKVYFFCENNNVVFLYKIMKDLLLIALAYLFFINRQKKYILCCVIAIALLYWPKYLGPYFSLRHFYELLPFVCLALGILLQCNKYVDAKYYKYIVIVILFPIVLANVCTITHFECIESRIWCNLTKALENLKQTHAAELKDNPIIVLNTKEFDSVYYNVGIIEAVQLNFMNNNKPKILLDGSTSDLQNSRFKLFCKWLSECESQVIALLIWNKLNNEFDVKIIKNELIIEPQMSLDFFIQNMVNKPCEAL